jgi:hypothetical protein
MWSPVMGTTEKQPTVLAVRKRMKALESQFQKLWMRFLELDRQTNRLSAESQQALSKSRRLLAAEKGEPDKG